MRLRDGGLVCVCVEDIYHLIHGRPPERDTATLGGGGQFSCSLYLKAQNIRSNIFIEFKWGRVKRYRKNKAKQNKKKTGPYVLGGRNVIYEGMFSQLHIVFREFYLRQVCAEFQDKSR